MLHPDFPIETERLTLRLYEERDRAWLHALRSREEVMRLVPFGHEGLDEMDKVMAARMDFNGINAPGDMLMCLIEEKSGGARVGEVMLRYPEDHAMTGEIGFALLPDFQGKGYAFEAATAMMQLGFEGAGFHRIIAVTDGANTACRVLLGRLGLREEAYFREASYFKGAWHDDVIAAMLASEWRDRTGG